MDVLTLPALTFACYRFTLTAVEPLLLPPYKGSTLRGGFGHAFKRMVCFQPRVKTCAGCLLRYTCPYSYVFETPVPPDSEVLSQNEDAPLPLVIRAPGERKTSYVAGDTLDFDIVLIGKADQYLPYFLVAFQEVGRGGIGRFLELPDGRRRGRCKLTRVEAVDVLSGASHVVYDQAAPAHIRCRALPIDPSSIAAHVASWPSDRLTIDFVTPTRLKYEGRFVEDGPPFHVLLRRLLDRVSSLSYFHCGQRWELDFRGWIERAQAVQLVESQTRWANWERFSSRQQQQVRMGGLVGQVTYEGDLAPYLPLLALGEQIHVGKGTVFGNGQFRICLPAS